MQNCLQISKSDLKFNADSIIEYVKTPIIAVVKCDAYGITVQNAVDAWYESGVKFFAVSQPDEALSVRELGYDDIEILLMSPLFDAPTIELMLKNGVILTVSSEECAKVAAEFCGEYNVRAHVKIDTGMGRFGVRWTDFESAEKIYSVEGINFEGIFSHFALSFEKKYNKTKIQLDRFLAVTKYLKQKGIEVGIRHIANSCAAIRFEQTRLDAVRIGSALVGRLVCKTELPLKPIGKLEAEIIDIASLKKGDSTGYAMICKLKKDTNCAVAAIGFNSGFGVTRRSDSFRFIDVLRSIYHDIKAYKKQPAVYFNGKRLNVIGRIGNQFTLIDSGDSGIKIGDKVTADVNIMLVDSMVQRILVV